MRLLAQVDMFEIGVHSAAAACHGNYHHSSIHPVWRVIHRTSPQQRDLVDIRRREWM